MRYAVKSLLLVALALGAFACSRPVAAQTLTYSLQASSSDGRSVVPKLTWSTTPAALGCVAANDWSGNKAASGTETLAAVTVTKSYKLTCTWAGDVVARLSWTAPTQNTDGTPLTDLAGFRILWGTAADNLDQTVYLQNPAARTWDSPTLPAGAWFFGAKAFNALGLESDLSNVVTKTSVVPVNQSRTLDLTIRIPGTPTGLTVK